MATSTLLSPPPAKPFRLQKPPIQIPVAPYSSAPSRFLKLFTYSYSSSVFQKKKAKAALFGTAGFAALMLVGPASAAAAAADLPLLGSLQVLNEPPNALSLPTWAIHVSSVVEWVTAMALVWQYGEKSGYESWKGLAWGMVPLLGGAFCACTWHFFYNSETLEVLVALQAALTVMGNATMCFAAFRIYKSSERSSKNL